MIYGILTTLNFVVKDNLTKFANLKSNSNVNWY